MASVRLGAWLVALVLACSSVVVAGPVRRARADDSAQADAAARDEFGAGRQAYYEGSFTAALAHFERAYALSPRPELLYNIGRAADADGQAARAMSAYEAYLKALPAAENGDFVRARLAKMRANTKAEADQPGQPASATMRDAPPPSEGGPLSLSVAQALPASGPAASEARAAPGPVAAPRADGERRRWYKNPWLWTAAGVVVVGAVAGTVVASRAGEQRITYDRGTWDAWGMAQ